MSLGQHKRLKVAELKTHHRNPRKGDVDAIAGSLRANDQYRPIVVNKGTHTGRKNEVLAGNHTLMAARQLAETDSKWDQIDVWLIDVDDDQATRIVLADNRTSDLGTYDDKELFALLRDIDDLSGTAYVEDDLEYLKSFLDTQEAYEPPASTSKTEADGSPLRDPYEYSDDDDEPLDGDDTPFSTFDETISTDYRCPSCHYEWSGKPR